MGDRAQLQITDGTSSVFLYTHWGGEGLRDVLLAGMKFSIKEGRTPDGDTSYFMANIVRTFVGSVGIESSTGFGVGFDFHQNDDERGAPLVLNVDRQTVSFMSVEVKIDEFIANPELIPWK